AYVTRWIPAPERRGRPRAAPDEDPDDTVQVVARPATPDDTVRMRPARLAPSGPPPGMGLLKKGVVGLTAIGLAGWFFRRKP
ncbi:MAG TPA: hypothetical protein VFT47_04410, partial [Vicinamibacterales bacterium]|nr:hypothetical protein [Vicinamibacterales bacterium]